MRDRPNLSDAAILDALRAHYGLDATELTFLPLGADSGSAVFRANDAAGAAYLVKLRTDGGFSTASLAVPHHLHACDVPHLVAPLPSASGALWVPLDGFALALYPFLDVRMAAETGLADAQWRSLGATMRQIHDHTLPSALQATIPRERFAPSRRELLPDLERILGREALDDVGRELAACWRRRRETIHIVTSRADALGRALRKATLPLPLALCHGDLHTWNILLDDQQQWWLVDWDEVTLAPKERDLMFVMGGIASGLVSPQQTACFLQGYGETEIHAPALAYYRYAWAVQEIAAWAEWVVMIPALSAETRRAALHAFESLFEPGNIVALALSSSDEREMEIIL